jgi:hypothetical protein
MLSFARTYRGRSSKRARRTGTRAWQWQANITPSCEVERGASAPRRLVLHVEYSVRRTRAGRGSLGCLLCSSGCHRFANFQSYRFIVAALSDLQLIAAKAPVRTCPPGLGGVYFFCAACRPKCWLKTRPITSFDGRHGLCPCRDRESRSRSSTIFEARGPRLIKRPLPIASARRRTRTMTIFLRKCTTGGPQVDRSVDKLTAFVSGR